jgi:hypothetical protein
VRSKAGTGPEHADDLTARRRLPPPRTSLTYHLHWKRQAVMGRHEAKPCRAQRRDRVRPSRNTTQGMRNADCLPSEPATNAPACMSQGAATWIMGRRHVNGCFDADPPSLPLATSMGIMKRGGTVREEQQGRSEKKNGKTTCSTIPRFDDDADVFPETDDDGQS